MASRSSVFVNARVHLPGTGSRGAVISHNVEYIATRRGADRSATPDDLRRADLAERMGLAGYYAARPGSTALFDQDGAVPLREARRRLGEADGALATWVVSVRREEALELGLADKAEWERYCRANMTQALAVAMGVPESSVRWIAAEHENAEASKHVHVISWSSDGAFDRLMPRRDLARARAMLTDAGLAPALRAEMGLRDDARARAVDAARSIGREEAEVDLPPGGRISYAHLRRWHPDAARQALRSLDDAAARHPDLAEAAADYRAAVARMAGLKGLGGEAADRYVSAAMDDLRARQANALLRTVAPDRTAAPGRAAAASPRPADGPALRRRAARALEGEARACIGERRLADALGRAEGGAAFPRPLLERCPTFSLAAARAPAAVARALAGASRADRRARSPDDDAARRAARMAADILMAAASAALLGDPGRAAAGITKTIIRGVLP